MSKDDPSDEDVWLRAQTALDKSAPDAPETGELKARLAAYIAERDALEAKGDLPRGVRRRGERLLDEVFALEQRRDRLAKSQAQRDHGQEERASRQPRRPSQAQDPDRPRTRAARNPGRRNWE